MVHKNANEYLQRNNEWIFYHAVTAFLNWLAVKVFVRHWKTESLEIEKFIESYLQANM